MPAFVNGVWAPGVTRVRPTTPVNSDQRVAVVEFNDLLLRLSGVLALLGGQDVAVTTGNLARGTTVTLATGAQVIAINAVSAAIAAQTAQTFGALGTIPANQWGVIAVERVLAGTTTFVSGAANYTTGYASEAAALAALPAQTADRVRVGHITIRAGASGWVAGTDALQGGTGGNPAAATNYYNTPGVADADTWVTIPRIANEAGTVISSTAG